MEKYILSLKNIFYHRSVCAVRRFLVSPIASAVLVIVAGAITWCGVEVPGAAAFVCICCAYLVLCDDLLSILPPLLLISTFTLKCYDSFDLFWPYRWLAIPAALAILIHCIAYRKRPIFVSGENLPGSIAVAVAVTLGGCFKISKEAYFSGVSLYYVIALGVGMVLWYLVLRASLAGRDIRAECSRFAVILYGWGAFAAYMVLQNLFVELPTVLESHLLPEIQWGNNISTVLMLTLPVPFHFARKKPYHLISALIFYAALICTVSRGGLLMGTIEFVLLIIYVLVTAQTRSARVGIGAFAVVLAGIASRIFLNSDTFDRFDALFHLRNFFSKTEDRVQLIERSIRDFLDAPIFGQGLGYSGNTDIYAPKRGALYFYHMMIPQILGSMGLCGAAAYLTQGILRLRTLFRHRCAMAGCFFFSYIGILLMSQVNPGEFVPIPYELVTVTLFALMESMPLVMKKKRDSYSLNEEIQRAQ